MLNSLRDDFVFFDTFNMCQIFKKDLGEEPTFLELKVTSLTGFDVD